MKANKERNSIIYSHLDCFVTYTWLVVWIQSSTGMTRQVNATTVTNTGKRNMNLQPFFCRLMMPSHSFSITFESVKLLRVDRASKRDLVHSRASYPLSIELPLQRPQLLHRCESIHCLQGRYLPVHPVGSNKSMSTWFKEVQSLSTLVHLPQYELQLHCGHPPRER